ncbi:hypothetical protein A2Y85_03065 [candidate division WOR-3 bacterium RBG_13_43_14]|uniref:Fis family transcriptional regulator n=1 Tax=candidate division WOR-3 bacterium RBG_13_43_14 TaxID=1802590 RepID=A0A1F4UFK5_UNCW3|nr:MAG: hypothetical protein A2Y85_03065 [candidate division WOR-3 bacterium RBG_13_43_14]
MAKILIIDDNENIRINLTGILNDEGHETVAAADGEQGLKLINESEYDAVLLDMKLPGIDGLEVLKQVKEKKPEIEIILISGHGTIADAVQAMKLGAYDFIEKPLSMDRVLIMINHALEKRNFTRQRKEWLQKEERRFQMIGKSPVMDKIWQEIKNVAGTKARVLILGESGTGKELVSYWIHRYSNRYSKPFIKVNCAAIPSELIESELFGYEKGAFTGAIQRRIGKFELAHRGTIFLDEIGDMSLATQAKVLRVIEDGEVLRLGCAMPVKVDVRIVSATNKDIAVETKKGNFRTDLLHRINVFQIYLPPLRERRADIPLLVEHILKEYSLENGTKLKTINKDALDYITTLSFSGNIRELKNIIERAIIISAAKEISLEDLKFSTTYGVKTEKDVFNHTQNLSDAKNELEKKYLKKQLELNGWNISKTAEKLGIQRSNLSRRIHQLDIEKGK